MFGLLCGAFQALTSRPQFNVLIIGLDRAGKTVRGGGPCGRARVRLRLRPQTPPPQTFLEQIKSHFLNMKPLQQEQIRPTVGLNSERVGGGAALRRSPVRRLTRRVASPRVDGTLGTLASRVDGTLARRRNPRAVSRSV